MIQEGQKNYNYKRVYTFKRQAYDLSINCFVNTSIKTVCYCQTELHKNITLKHVVKYLKDVYIICIDLNVYCQQKSILDIDGYPDYFDDKRRKYFRNKLGCVNSTLTYAL